MRSTAYLFPRLMSNLKIMLYQGYIPIYFAHEDNLIFVMELLRRLLGYPLFHGMAWRDSKLQHGKFGMTVKVS
jgi:hypothetical protein